MVPRGTRWVSAVVVALIGIALGMAAGSGLAVAAREPVRMPSHDELVAIGALVFPHPVEAVWGEEALAREPQEDAPMRRWWEKILLGYQGQDASAGVSWSGNEYITESDEVAYQRLRDAEAAFRGAGWTVDGYRDGVTRVDGVPTYDDVLDVHRGDVAVEVTSYGGTEPVVYVYSSANPVPAVAVIAGGVVGLAVAAGWLLWRRRYAARATAAGVVGVALMAPSAAAVWIAALVTGAWGGSAAYLLEEARATFPFPLGAVLNAGLVLVVVDAVLVRRRAKARARRGTEALSREVE